MNFYTCIAIVAVCAAIPFILESIAKLIIASKAQLMSDGMAVMVVERRCGCQEGEEAGKDESTEYKDDDSETGGC